MLQLDSTQLHVAITVDSSWKARHDTASPRRAAYVMLPTSFFTLLSSCSGSVDATTPPSTILYLE